MGQGEEAHKNFVKWLMEAPFHIIICGRQKNVFDDEDGDVKKVGVTMNAERDTAYEPQICLRLECKVNKKDTTRSVFYAYAEKDRTGLLAGRTLANMTYKEVAPVVALLSGEQSTFPDPDETAMKDAELMEQQEAAIQKKKADKSVKHLTDYSKKISAAKNLEALQKIAEELKTKRGQLEDDHRDALLSAWETKARQIRGEA